MVNMTMVAKKAYFVLVVLWVAIHRLQKFNLGYPKIWLYCVIKICMMNILVIYVLY